MALILPNSAMIHVPKTGGTWCRMAIQGAGIPYFESGPAYPHMTRRFHAPFRDVRETIMVEQWEENNTRPVRRLVFGFVRNPLTWLESKWADAFEHDYKPGMPLPPEEEWFCRCYALDFIQYLNNVVRLVPNAPSSAILGRLGYHSADQRWVPDEHTPDFIGRVENLVEDFICALHRAGETFNESAIRALEPQRVSSQLPKYKETFKWQPEQQQAIYDANRQLFDGFGYAI